MGTFASFIKSHVQADERKSRKRLITISVLVILLTALIAGVVGVRTLIHRSGSGDASSKATTPAEAVKSICSLTLYPKSCFSSLIPANSADPEVIFKFSLAVAIKSLEAISKFPDDYASGDQLVKQALVVCGAVLRDAADTLRDAVSEASLRDTDDLRTWLSAALTNQDTCLDALAEAGAAFAGEVKRLMGNTTEFASNSLAIVSKLLAVVEREIGGSGHGRRLLAETGDHIPSWVDRRILKNKAGPVWDYKADVVVGKNGSGNVSTISEAVAMVPMKSEKMFVIKLNAGVYEESVVINKSCWNVVLVGAGRTNTIITGSRNKVDGIVTFNTASLAVFGRGFVAKGITFENKAGPEKHQAVAFLSDSDKSVYYQCTFRGYQDTLYAHANRQFYRECDIYGTVDFIFGNAAVVFQECNIIPIEPLANQFVTITAQGKKDLNQNTGISMHMCVISPFNMSGLVQTYLGRPWKPYSTTVIMMTNISRLVSPLGWTPWDTNNETLKTIFYGEYKNTGDGSITTQRVTWKGYHADLGAEASRFSVQSFTDANSWLPTIGVPYKPTL